MTEIDFFEIIKFIISSFGIIASLYYWKLRERVVKIEIYQRVQHETQQEQTLLLKEIQKTLEEIKLDIEKRVK